MVPSHAEPSAMYLMRLVLEVLPIGGGGGDEWHILDGEPIFGPEFFPQFNTGSSVGL